MTEKVCSVCGHGFVPKKGRQIYCSRQCADRSKHVAEERVCQHCGRHFHVESYEVKRGSGKYCSRSCSTKAKAVAAGAWLIEWGTNPADVITKVAQCPVCGRSINLTSQPQRKYCSADCAREGALRHRIAAAGEKPLCRCQRCGREFQPEYGDKRRDFCSERCHRKQAKAKREKAIRDAWRSHVRPQDIAERDEWCCQLCGEPVDRNVSVPHPLAPTIDHVVPLARGGTHEPDNVQLAHFGCNVRKGATVAALSENY